MCLFNLFGNADKKNIKINNANKAQILTLIEQTKMSSTSPEAVAFLGKVQTEISRQSEASAKEVIEIDAQILDMLNKAKLNIAKKQVATAITQLIDVLELSIDRSLYCNIGGAQTKADMKARKQADKALKNARGVKNAPKTRLEELQENIDKYVAEKDSLERKFEVLRELNNEFPGNAAIQARARALQPLIAAAGNKINSYTVELVVTSSVDAGISTKEVMDEIDAGRTYSEAEIVNIVEDIKARKEEENKRVNLGSQINEVLNMGAATGDVFAQGNSSSSILSGDVFAQSNTASATSASNQQTQFGGFDASEISSKDMARDIKRTMQEIQKNIDEFTDKIEDASEELQDFNSELRPLLQKRQNASPSDCLVLDGMIDQINAKRNGVINKIKRYRQAVAQLNDKLSLMDKLNTQQGLSSMNKQIEELTGGRFADLEGIAMFINESVKESNAALEDVGIAVSVSESEDILMNSGSAAAANLYDAGSINKDENKYDALQRELGMMI